MVASSLKLDSMTSSHRNKDNGMGKQSSAPAAVLIHKKNNNNSNQNNNNHCKSHTDSRSKSPAKQKHGKSPKSKKGRSSWQSWKECRGLKNHHSLFLFQEYWCYTISKLSYDISYMHLYHGKYCNSLLGGIETGINSRKI